MNSAKRKSPARVRRLFESLESRQLLSASASQIVTPSITLLPSTSASSSVQGYTPAQIKSAYGITGTGAGQTIAIVDAYSDPSIASDLAVFDKQFSLTAPPSFTQESATGSTTKLPAQDASWDSEISLDVEWAHAVAPKAKIILVDASSDTMNGLMAAVKFARSITGVSVVSMSWGGSEFASETSYDKYFTTPSGHTGITFVAASGDSGAAGGAEYPAASPNVLGVGGTTLTLSTAGTVEGETAWSDSEGGVSAYEATPSYQSTVSSSGRSTPDVSYNADPNTGFAVYDSVTYQGYTGWQEVGGTSAGTPQWGAIIALADQARAANGLGTLTTTQTLNALYSIYANPTTYAKDFTDITSGSSPISYGGGYGDYGDYGGYGGGGFGGFGGFGHGRYAAQFSQAASATTGYDTLTGLGTPKATALVQSLAAASASTSAVQHAGTTSTATAVPAKASKKKLSAAFVIAPAAANINAARIATKSAPAVRAEIFDLDIQSSASVASTVQSTPPRASIVDVADRPGSLLPLEVEVALPTHDATDGDQTAATNHLILKAPSAAGMFSDTPLNLPSDDPRTQNPPPLATIPPTLKSTDEDNSTWALSIVVAADAVLLGYLHHRKRKAMFAGEIWSD
jgi:subtilase family serine protease